MSATPLHRALVGFRIVLGVVLLLGSAHTAIFNAVRGATGQHFHPHVALLAGVEAVGALFLLVPRVRQLGAVLLVLTIMIAFVTHLLRREPRPDLLVYAAGAILVAVHDRSQAGGGTAGA